MSTSGDPSESGSRRNQGRRKINMEKIENESNLQVTFSKRRAGLFKKASELSTLTGAEAGVVVFSPGGKAHSFGHPNINTVANRYLNSQAGNPSHASTEDQEDMAATRQRELDYLAEVERMTAMEKERGEKLLAMKKTLEKEKMVPPGIEALNFEQLNMLKGSVVDFQKNLESHVRQRMAYPTPPPYAMEPLAASQPLQGFGGPRDVAIDPYGEGQSTVVPYDQGASGVGGDGDHNGGGKSQIRMEKTEKHDSTPFVDATHSSQKDLSEKRTGLRANE